MLLAGILALCLPLFVPAAARTSGVQSVVGVRFATQTQSDQAPATSTTQTQPPAPNPGTQPAAPPKAAPRKHKKKPVHSPADSTDAPPKKVVTQGSTESPTTHLSPSMTDEQTAKTRAANTELLNDACANLKKVTGRSLNAEQQETADQIKKFVEQAKAADQEGDLQRAGTFANKAKLLSDSLEETSRPK